MKNDHKGIALWACSALLAFTAFGAGGLLVRDLVSTEPASTNSGLQVEVAPSGIGIKELTSVTNADGSFTKTFAYTVSPNDATFKNLTYSLAYTDGSSVDTKSKTPDSYISIVISEENLTIAITCSGAFTKQIAVTFACERDTSVTATMTLDYEKDVVGMHLTKFEFAYDVDEEMDDFYPNVVADFGDGTVDPEVEFQAEHQADAAYWCDEFIEMGMFEENEEGILDDAGDAYYFAEYVFESWYSEGAIDMEELTDQLDEPDVWARAFIEREDATNQTGSSITINTNVQINEINSGYSKIYCFNVTVNFGYGDWDPYYTRATSIGLESGSITFNR